MQPVDVKATRPAEYLREGFFDVRGQVRPRLNGECSLGMAYRLLDEKVGPDALKRLVDELRALGGRHPHQPSQALSTAEEAGLRKVLAAHRAGAAAPLGELLDAVEPLVKDWKSYDAAVEHLERIMTQMALIRAGGPGAGA